MGEFNPDTFERLQKRVDQLVESPSKRAEKLWAHLPDKDNITNWDLACFCIESLGLICNTDLIVFKPFVRDLNRLLYQLHYQAPHRIGLLTEKQYNELCKVD
jgi:hypothetical protein